MVIAGVTVRNLLYIMRISYWEPRLTLRKFNDKLKTYAMIKGFSKLTGRDIPETQYIIEKKDDLASVRS